MEYQVWNIKYGISLNWCPFVLPSPLDPSVQVPLVLELPVDAQGYRLISGCGPEGLYNMVSDIM